MGFVHEAVGYEGPPGFAAAVAPFVEAGLDAGEPTMVAVRAPQKLGLEEALGARARDVRFVDMLELGRNPGRIIPAWRDFLTEHEGTAVRGVGEPIWSGRDREELVEAQLHEALLNVAFADASGFRLLCPYDCTSLDPAVLHEASRTHGSVAVEGLLEPFQAPLPPPAVPAQVLAFDRSSLDEVRAVVAARAAALGLGRARAQDLVLAVDELATNSVRHGGGNGILRMWEQDGSLVGEVRDRGRLRDALIGRRRPGPAAEGGWGLYVTHQVCDLVQVRSDRDGTVVRVRMRLR